MPLSRLEVRSVYGMSQTELLSNDDREDPKSILNGVTVSGIVGILRQLGDLAEFAAEIFHGIQEEVMATASRSNQLKIRLKHIDSTVPPLEKAILAQTNHIHFAYTRGLEWHPRIQNEQNHLIYDDLPRIIMDPYEECRDPPRLHLLDKFDINGPGSCLKRYSDPAYFKRASRNSIQGSNKFQKDKKTKKKKSSRSRDMARLASVANQSARSGSGYNECLSTATSSLRAGEKSQGACVSSSLTPESCTIASESETEDAHDNFQFSPPQGEAVRASTCVSWDEKAEIVEAVSLQINEATETMETNSIVDPIDENVKSESVLRQDSGIDEVREIQTGLEIVEEPRDSEDESESGGDCFVDAPYTIESESENDQRLQTSQEVVNSSCGVTEERLEKSVLEQATEQISNNVEDSCRPMNDQRLQTSQEVVNSSCGVTEERLEKSVLERATEQISNNVEDSCRSMNFLMDNGFGNDEKSCDLVEKLPSDEMNHQDPRVSSDISGGEDNIAFTFVPAPENCSSASSNPLYHSDRQEHQKSEAETSWDIEPIKIWTNGGLLGLKPSKPPVLAVPSSLSLDCKTEEKNIGSAESEKDKSDDQKECRDTSSGVFGLSHKLLTNSFCRGDSFSYDKQALPVTIPENDEPTTEKKSSFCDQDKTLMDPFIDEAPIDWFTSSPPLRHMKISLNPIDTLQASRLKLKFSEGDNNMFSSFQLLPEAATSLPDSYSDDDTFCRSSPYMSDSDYLSDNLSNSEQWEESSDSHGRKEQELYDFLHESSHVGNNAESESGCVAVNLSYLHNPAEPLPPIQRTVSKTPSERLEVKTQSLQLHDALRFAFEKHIEQPSVVTSAPKPEIKVHVENNVRGEKQSVNEKETEAGDFLQQIRTQQFNLRPLVLTTTSSAATTSDPTINTKISAILEKANSIRQAVASNGGDESDTWSDT